MLKATLRRGLALAAVAAAAALASCETGPSKAELAQQAHDVVLGSSVILPEVTDPFEVTEMPLVSMVVFAPELAPR